MSQRWAPSDKRSGKKELEAFFSTDTSLTEAQTLQHYSQRWDVEIDIRDAYAYYGLGKDQCRNLDRIYGVNSFRILMATCRTLWFVRYFEERQLKLKKLRPWYRLKQHPTQLDVISAAQEAFVLKGVLGSHQVWEKCPTARRKTGSRLPEKRETND